MEPKTSRLPHFWATRYSWICAGWASRWSTQNTEGRGTLPLTGAVPISLTFGSVYWHGFTPICQRRPILRTDFSLVQSKEPGAPGTRSAPGVGYSSASYAPFVMWKSGGFSGASEYIPVPLTFVPQMADTAGVTETISGFAYSTVITSFLDWYWATSLASRAHVWLQCFLP